MVYANCTVSHHTFAEQLAWMEGALYVYIFVKTGHVFVILIDCSFPWLTLPVSLLLSWHTQFYIKVHNTWTSYIYTHTSLLTHNCTEASGSAPEEEKPNRKWEWNSDPTYVTQTWAMPDLPHTSRSPGILLTAIEHFSFPFYPIPQRSLFSIIHDTLWKYTSLDQWISLLICMDCSQSMVKAERNALLSV